MRSNGQQPHLSSVFHPNIPPDHLLLDRSHIHRLRASFMTNWWWSSTKLLYWYCLFYYMIYFFNYCMMLIYCRWYLKVLQYYAHDHLLLDCAPNIGPLISRWELDTLKNCWNKSFRTSKFLTLLYHQFSDLLISQRDMSGPRLGALSNNRWLGVVFLNLVQYLIHDAFLPVAKFLASILCCHLRCFVWPSVWKRTLWSERWFCSWSIHARLQHRLQKWI
jgi:hypothetical protein